jgi:uncharacterized membrane protein YcaP (DUF421 family)
MLDEALGLSRRPQDLTAGQMALRAVIVFGVALLLVRISGKRLLGHHSTFDLVVTIVLGSVISRAVNGAAGFFETLGAAGVLVGAQWVTGAVAVRSPRFRSLTEGDSDLLYEDGKCDERAMRRSHVAHEDLDMAAREAQLEGLEDAQRIMLEHNGRFSVLPKDDETK